MAGDSIATRLASEVQRQLELQAKLGEALLRELQDVAQNGRMQYDFEGRERGMTHVPDRDWARCYGHYKTANKELLAEERERTKLKLLVQGKDNAHALTDDEYQAEMRTLAMESVRQLSDSELEAEIRARGLNIEPPKERDE